MKERIHARRRSDRADSSLVSMVFLLPLFFGFLMTMIDTSVYFANKATIQQITRDGARSVAIFGGNGTNSTVSPLEKTYGGSTAPCNNAASVNKTSVECALISRLGNASGLTNVKIERVLCGPATAVAIGQTTFCEADWTYGGIPGSTMSFLRRGGESATGANGWCPANAAALTCNATRTTGQSEVNMTGVAMANR